MLLNRPDVNRRRQDPTGEWTIWDWRWGPVRITHNQTTWSDYECILCLCGYLTGLDCNSSNVWNSVILCQRHRECANEHANSADLSTVHSRTLSINHKWQANYIRFDRKTQERPTNYAQTLHLKGPEIGRDVMIQGYLSQVQLASHES